MPSREVLSRLKALKWDQQRRLKYIEFELYWHGEVTRQHLIKLFKVTENTARADFRRYRADFGGAMSRDEHSGRYTAMPSFTEFKPKLSDTLDSEAYLNFLANRGFGADLSSSTDSTHARPRGVETYEPPILDRSQIDPTCLREVLWAMRTKRQLKVCYRSPHSSEERWFYIFPTAFGFDGFRWACRCWRGDHSRWGEVVLDRIEEVKEPEKVDLAELGRDTDWETMVTVVLGPNPGLTESQRLAVERQYEMKAGRIAIEVRKCFIVYFLKRYQLEEPTTQKAPHQAPIVVMNRVDVTALIPPRMRVPPTE